MIRYSAFILILLLGGCSSLDYYKNRNIQSSSLVSFLYPDGKMSLQDIQNPSLNLPLRVGMAFIPEKNNKSIIPQTTKNQLLEDIKKEFASKDYVHEIVIIPEIYLSHQHGFNPLEQLKNLYQLDVLALVSYDQIINTKDKLLSLSYLTIVGAYVFSGTGFDVHTMIDFAVIDIPTRQILFRSAGVNSSEGNSVALAYSDEAFRKKQNNSFVQAMQQVKVNLSNELEKFEQRLREPSSNETITVNKREGYSGGSISLFTVFGLGIMVLFKFIAAYKMKIRHDS